MTTETEIAQTTETQQDQADAAAAFEAGFEGKDTPPAAKPEEKSTPAEAAAAAAAASPASAASESAATSASAAAASTQASTDPNDPAGTEAATTRSPSPKPDDDLRAKFRELEGRYGALHSELKQLKTTKEAEGKPAVATKVELARMKAEYPELDEILTEDLTKLLGGLATMQADPKAMEELVTQRVQEGVAKEAARLRDAAVDDAHPNWRTDVFSVDEATRAKKPTAEYLAWRATLGEEKATAFENSTNPYHVIRQLNAFYEFKGKAAKAQAEKDARLKAAVRPQGVPRASPPTTSDDEAMRKGFEEGFNS